MFDPPPLLMYLMTVSCSTKRNAEGCQVEPEITGIMDNNQMAWVIIVHINAFY